MIQVIRIREPGEMFVIPANNKTLEIKANQNQFLNGFPKEFFQRY